MNANDFPANIRPTIEQARTLLLASDEELRNLDPALVRGLAQLAIDDAQTISNLEPAAAAYCAIERLVPMGTITICERSRVGARTPYVRFELELAGEEESWASERSTLEGGVAAVTFQAHKTLTARVEKLSALADRLEPLDIPSNEEG